MCTVGGQKFLGIWPTLQIHIIKMSLDLFKYEVQSQSKPDHVTCSTAIPHTAIAGERYFIKYMLCDRGQWQYLRKLSLDSLCSIRPMTLVLVNSLHSHQHRLHSTWKPCCSASAWCANNTTHCLLICHVNFIGYLNVNQCLHSVKQWSTHMQVEIVTRQPFSYLYSYGTSNGSVRKSIKVSDVMWMRNLVSVIRVGIKKLEESN